MPKTSRQNVLKQIKAVKGTTEPVVSELQRVENYQTNNQFCCLGRYLAWAYLATRSWWRALRAGAYQLNHQTIIVFLFAFVVVINLDDGVCWSLLIVIAGSLPALTFVWQLEPLFASLNVIERQGREIFVVKRFFPESQVQELWAARLMVGYTFVFYQIQKIEMITDTQSNNFRASVKSTPLPVMANI